MKNGVKITKPKLLIINSLQGGGGHRLGRIFSCYKDVYWYAHPDNGKTPWTFGINNTKYFDYCKESDFSKYHYDRILPYGVRIPLIGERIEKYWDNQGWVENWYNLIKNIDLPNKYITFIVHDGPKYIREIFPDSYIVNLTSDPEIAAKRHLETSANFRIDFVFDKQTPDYKSKWVKKRDELLKINPEATEKDLWIYINNSSEEEYISYVKEKTNTEYNRNLSEKSFANTTISWNNFNPLRYQLKFGKLSSKYKLLINNLQ